MTQGTVPCVTLRFVEEYEDPDNTYTRVYVINRKEWEEKHET